MDFSALTFALALGYSQYTDEAGPEPRPHVRIELGLEDKPYYMWGQLEQPTTRSLGQRLGETWIGGVGFGYRYSFAPNLYVYGELGYNYVDPGANETIQQETIFKEFANNHVTENDPLPVPLSGIPYDASTYGTLWDLDHGLTGALGVGLELTKRFTIDVAWRPFYVEERTELFDPNTRFTVPNSWWQETRSRDYSAFQVNFKLTF
jgi:hypothetical protein